MTEPWDEHQKHLVERIYWAYMRYNQWPVYQWIEADLWKEGFEALEIIRSFPVIGGPSAFNRKYSDLDVALGDLPRPEVRVGLTVGGMEKMAQSAQLVDVFIGALRLAATVRASAQYDPTNVVGVRLGSEELLASFRDSPLAAPYLMDVYRLLTHEPVHGFGSSGSDPEKKTWFCELDSTVLRYVDVTAQSYLAMVEADMAEPPDQPGRRIFAHVPDLATAFTYLDTTWRLHEKRSLLNVQDLSGVTSLAYPAATGDEYAARCSAMADVVKSLQAPGAPGVSGHSVTRLAAYIKTRLDDEGDYAGLDEAVATLDRVRDARDARSHGAAQPKGQVALQQLGVPGPPFDWPSAWATIQNAAAIALMDLRDIVARLPAR